MIDTEILQDYSSEARELLDEMENSLMRLEKEGGTSELLNNIFRAVHCIKGSAEYIGLERSSTLTHGVENLLDRLREGITRLDTKIVDFLFRAKDLIALLIQEVARDHEEKTEISDMMDQLEVFLHDSYESSGEFAPKDSSRPSEDFGSIPAEATVVECPPGLLPPAETGIVSEPEALATVVDDFLQGSQGLAPEPVVGLEQAEQTSEEVAEAGPSLPAEPTEELLPAPDQWVDEMALLADTVAHIGSIALYLDDLQDGLQPVDVLASIQDKLARIRSQLVTGGPSKVLDSLDEFQKSVDSLDVDAGGPSFADVENLRSLFEDLRSRYPEDLFAKEEEQPAEGPEPTEEPFVTPVAAASPFALELGGVPGLDQESIQAIVNAGFSSMKDLASSGLSDLTAIPGVSADAAQAVLRAAGVVPEVPKQPPVVSRSADRSLLADVDDELLREFESIFGEPEPDQDVLSPVDEASRGENSRTLLEELEAVGQEADREIMEIFLSYGWEILDKLRPLVWRVKQGAANRGELEKCAELIRSIRSSSTYMDYQNLASFLDDWYEKTLWVSTRIDSLAAGEFAFMDENLVTFQDFLGGLDRALNPGEEREVAAAVTPKGMGTPVMRASEVPGQQAKTTPPASPEAVQAATPTPGPPQPQFEVRTGPAQTHLLETPTEDLMRSLQAAPLEQGEALAPAVTGPQRPPIAEQADLGGPQVDITQESALVKTMRVDSSKVDVLLNQVGELVVNRSYVEQLAVELKNFQRVLMGTPQVTKREILAIKDLTLKVAEASLSLGRVANDIQEGVMKLRMLPVGQLFNRMPRLIRDLSRRVGKSVGLHVFGGDTEVDKRVIEQIYNPLVHLIRNAVDHGIEDVETRRKLGKAEEGSIYLRAYSEGNQVVIDVEDDGTGIDTEAVLKKAVENRLIDSQETKGISAQEVYNFLFLPGFSTSEKVTRTSGRGVGMDVVKKDVEKINGHVEIESWESQGTKISIKIPLTLAIIQTLLIRIGKHVFAMPLTSVREIIQVSSQEIITIEGFEVIKFREETIPVLRVNEIFRLKDYDASRQPKFLVLATAGLKSVGLLVDELIGEQDVVIKPLAEHVCEIRGLAGSTILGDGTISLVLDVAEIVDDIIFQQRQLSAAAAAR